jgi:hypothetical protein
VNAPDVPQSMRATALIRKSPRDEATQPSCPAVLPFEAVGATARNGSSTTGASLHWSALIGWSPISLPSSPPGPLEARKVAQNEAALAEERVALNAVLVAPGRETAAIKAKGGWLKWRLEMGETLDAEQLCLLVNSLAELGHGSRP